jgi:2-dehydro-3-deoxyphosphogluconate aldolase / (4S)-4-hydroxy-2-oxoglutarate aldolase
MKSPRIEETTLKADWLAQVRAYRAIAVIRTSHAQTGLQMARAVAQGGMRLIEITWNSERPAAQIEACNDLPNCVIGAGTLLNSRQVQEAIAAGAKFLFTPHVDPALIRLATQQGVPMIPGALSPTEIVTAWQAGAASVKVFPIQSVGGVGYIKSLQGPLGHIPLIPTGGVTPENARDFLRAGAIAVGLSGQLFPEAAIATQNWNIVTHHAQTLLQRLGSEIQ